MQYHRYPPPQPQMIPANYFCKQLAANVDNKGLTDSQFREMIRNTLPIVDCN